MWSRGENRAPRTGRTKIGKGNNDGRGDGNESEDGNGHDDTDEGENGSGDEDENKQEGGGEIEPGSLRSGDKRWVGRRERGGDANSNQRDQSQDPTPQ